MIGRQTAGSIVRMRPYGRGDWLFVVSPSGIELKIPSRDGGSIDLWLPEPGEWTAQWEKGEVETIEVVRAELESEQESEPVVDKPSASLSTTSV